MSLILLVDDEPAMATLVGMTLEGAGIQLIQASTLPEARAALEIQKPDVILLDLSLGSEDGMTLLSEDPSLVGRIPVVVFSIHDSRTDEALRLGARSFLKKPFRRAALRAAIHPHLTEDLG